MAARELASRVVSHPRLFDAQTALLGARRLERVMQPMARRVTQGRPRGVVVDVGGGTASAHALWPVSWTYVSLDTDLRVIPEGLSDGIRRIVGDASRLAFADRSVDVVLMKGVAHHLDDTTWIRALAEAHRVLKSDGRLCFVEGLWSRRRWISRLGWMADAGQFPRGATRLCVDVERWFEVEDMERLTLLHHCIVITARPTLNGPGVLARGDMTGASQSPSQQR